MPGASRSSHGCEQITEFRFIIATLISENSGLLRAKLRQLQFNGFRFVC
jgi:hypothetical protein